MAKLFDLYIKEELLKQCEEHFAKFLEEQEGGGYITKEDYSLFEDQIDYLFEMMDNIIGDYKKRGLDEFEAYAQIIDQLCGYCVLGKMNEARLCNMLNDLMGKEDE